MRENRTYGSEGGEGNSFPTPIPRRGDHPRKLHMTCPQMAGEDARPPRGGIAA